MGIRTINSDGSILVAQIGNDTVNLRVANDSSGSYTTSDSSYVNTSSLETITALTLPVGNGGVYVVEFRAQLSIANAAHNIKFSMDDGTATAAFCKTEWLFSSGATTLTVLGTASTSVISGGAATAWTAVHMRGIVSFSAGGKVLIQAAQAVAGLSATSVLAHASLRATRIKST